MAHVNISMSRTKGMIEKVNNVSLLATVNVNIGNRFLPAIFYRREKPWKSKSWSQFTDIRHTSPIPK